MLGWAKINVVVWPGDPEEAILLAVADNQIGQQSRPDLLSLAGKVVAWQESGHDMKGLGFDVDALREVLLERDGEDDPSGPGGPNPTAPATDVKVVQVFMAAAEHEHYLRATDRLMEAWGMNRNDATLRAVRTAHDGVGR